MSSHSFAQIDGVASIGELAAQTPSDKNNPRVIILGCSYSPEAAISEAARLRQTVNSAKIVFLFGSLGPADVQHVITSAIDACIPLDASGEILIKMIDLLSTEDVRAIIWGRALESEAPDGEQVSLVPLQLGLLDQSKECREQTFSNSGVEVPSAFLSGNGEQLSPQLSERECQILHGLTLGHANKLIARTYNITEATVKVHMKAILRKINVANRTQAAIWAMQHPRMLNLKIEANHINGSKDAIELNDDRLSV